jgi:hypothetical protein
VGLQGTSTKQWLHIQDVAATVQAVSRKDGASGLTVLVAGMDKIGLIGVLERAFRHRGFGIENGEWIVKGSLLHAYFNLYPVVVDAANKPRSDFDWQKVQGALASEFGTEAGKVKSLHTEFLDEGVAGNSDPTFESEELDPSLLSVDVPLLKVDIDHTMGEEMHVGLLALVREHAGRTVRGILRRGRCEGSGQEIQKDSFWIDCIEVETLMNGALSSPDILQDKLRQTRAELEKDADNKSVDSPSDDSEAGDSLLDALRLADRKALKKLMLELPVAVQDIVKKTPYEVKPSVWGQQLESFQKYMGAGISLEDENIEGAAPVLQFTTLFVQKKNIAHTGPQKIRRSLADLSSRQYGEFTNSIDVNRRSFIIQRVFLNKVCPSSCHIGSSASAEHLFAPVWEKGALGLGELLPVHKIQEIKLSDVVNWNTYACLAVAMIQRGECEDMFGEHFQRPLDEELHAAGLTPHGCKTLPLVDVFKQTCLGKFVRRILDAWNQRTGVQLKCVSAQVVFHSDGKEIIAGEARAAMDVLVKTEVDFAASAALEEKAPAGAGAQPGQTPESAAKAALDRWMGKLKVSSADFDLGSSEVCERAALNAVIRCIKALQDERGWSCLLVADDADERSGAKLSKARGTTDAALVDALQLITKAEVLREVSTSLILLRTVVDQNLGSKGSWEERYNLVCANPRAFNILICALLDFTIGACKGSPDITDSQGDSISSFCYFREQLGRERAFVLSRGRARALDQAKDKDMMSHVVMMSARRALIGDLLKITTRFATAFRQLDEAEQAFMADDQHSPEDFMKVISACIDLVQKLIDNLISGDPLSPLARQTTPFSGDLLSPLGRPRAASGASSDSLSRWGRQTTPFFAPAVEAEMMTGSI